MGERELINLAVERQHRCVWAPRQNRAQMQEVKRGGAGLLLFSGFLPLHGGGGGQGSNGEI